VTDNVADSSTGSLTSEDQTYKLNKLSKTFKIQLKCQDPVDQ